MTLSYKEFGKGFPLVLLHAFPLSNKMWKSNISSFKDSNFRLIIPDLPGFGKSKLKNENFTIEEIAKDVALLLSELKIKQTLLGGISMGGYVSLNFFRLFPNLISGLILCDTTSFADSEEIKKNRFRLIEKIKQKGSKVLLTEMLPNLLSKHTKTKNQTLFAHLENEIINCNSISAISALKGMAGRLDHTYLLRKINVPTLLIFGEEDRPTNLETANLLKNEIRGSTLKIIKNAGHYSNMENPKDFNEILQTFLKENNFEK